MSTDTQHPAQRAEWLDEVERFALRADDAPLALAALAVRHNGASRRCFAALLCELARVTGECATTVFERAQCAAASQHEHGAESAALLARGWELLAIEREARR